MEEEKEDDEPRKLKNVEEEETKMETNARKERRGKKG